MLSSSRNCGISFWVLQTMYRHPGATSFSTRTIRNGWKPISRIFLAMPASRRRTCQFRVEGLSVLIQGLLLRRSKPDCNQLVRRHNFQRLG